MHAAVALALAASLAAAPDGDGAGAAPAAPLRPVLAAPAGSSLSLEGRIGVARCGYCGLVLGVGLTERLGAFLVGAFADVAAEVGHSAPTSTTPSVTAGSYFFGGQAGAVGELRSGDRVALAGEAGVQLASSKAEWSASSGIPSREAREVIPILGARATVELRLGDGDGTIGLAAFVRQPLGSPCMDVGAGCDRPTTTIGIVLQGSVALTRR